MRLTVQSAVSKRPSFGRLLVVLVSSVFLSGIACTKVERTQTANEASPSTPQISTGEVQLAGMRLFSGGDPQTFGVAGQVLNNSPQHTLTEVQLQVVMQDCTDVDCTTIGEQVATVPTSVPPGQASDIEAEAHFEGMPEPQGKLGWRYSVVGTKASEPE
jgi:hypothetical protein